MMTHQNLRLGKCWKLFLALIKNPVFSFEKKYANDLIDLATMAFCLRSVLEC